MHVRTWRYTATLLSTAMLVFFTSAAAAPDAHPFLNGELVAPAALEKLLPAPEGWTRGVARSRQIDIAADCSYTIASVSYARDEMQVKLTLADTDGHADSLVALAPMVISLPDDHVGQVPPATTITRLKVEGSPAVEMWDSEKLTGEIAVVVAGRFVVSVEASTADSLESLRAILAGVDLKALGALR
jgi:hypothetical protein